MSYCYIASPYSHEDPAIMEDRYKAVMKITAEYLQGKIHVYSPIVHCHEIAKVYSLPKDYNFWKAYNKTMLDKADKLIVVMLDGWENSIGVSDEIKFATSRNKHILFLPEEVT